MTAEERKVLRAELGLSQRDLSREAGLALPTVQRSEVPDGGCKQKTLDAIERALLRVQEFGPGLDTSPPPSRVPLLGRIAAEGPRGSASSLGGRPATLRGGRG